MSSATATATTTRTYALDPAHSEVLFQVRHLISKVRGRFSDFTGTIEFDAEDPQHSSVEFTIRTASIDTNQPERDAHLRSNDFFAVEEYPTMRFKSRAVTSRGSNRFDVVGDLTIRDVTRTVTFPITYLGTAKDPWGNEKLGFEGEMTLNRRDFGLTWNAALETGGFLVGDDVTVSLAVQAQAK